MLNHEEQPTDDRAARAAGERGLLRFVAVGSLFATVEEFLTVIVLRHDVMSYVLTLVVVFPVFLTFVWFSSGLIDRLLSSRAAREAVHLIAYGCVGLAFEWFVIGLSPWKMRDANPLLVIVFQAGMFAFWSTVGFAPRLFSQRDALSMKTRKTVLWFYVPYFVGVYAAAFSVPRDLQSVTVIGLIVCGYLVVNVLFAKHLLERARRGAAAPA